MREDGPVSDAFREALGKLDGDSFQALYGPIDPLTPEQVAQVLDRPKDRADLAAVRLDPAGRAWLADTLELLGYHEWARLARS